MYSTIRVTDAVNRLKVAFLQAPGTQLSIADASRLSGLERSTCRFVLEALEDAQLITKARNGLFVRQAANALNPLKEERMAVTAIRRRKETRDLAPMLDTANLMARGARIDDPIIMPAIPASNDNGGDAVDHVRIAIRAYELYLARGAQDGHDQEDWLQAEQEMR